jgi:hypothetical protein
VILAHGEPSSRTPGDLRSVPGNHANQMTPSHHQRRQPLHMDFALVAFDRVDTAAEAFATARDRSGATSRWWDQVALLEHHMGGHLVLRGTLAGHYVDVDESLHVSESGAAKGWRTGALIGSLLTPAGLAVGSVLGAVIGSQEGEPSERDPEPTLLVDKLRGAVPAPGSSIVMIGEAGAVDEMLSAAQLGVASVTRRTLSRDELAVLDIALSETPPAAQITQIR